MQPQTLLHLLLALATVIALASPLFAMMVVMALASTFAAAPLLRWLGPSHEPAASTPCSPRCWCADSSTPA